MSAVRSKQLNPETGNHFITFDLFNEPDWAKDFGAELIKIPCGKCYGCRLAKARMWATRAVLEASLHTHNCFITLTYDDAHLPEDMSLHRKHFQNFMKRLRKRYGKDIRVLYCGEYGTKNQRPHYHALLFNFDFPDRVSANFTSQLGYGLSLSPSLMGLWSYGYSSIGDLTYGSAKYVAGYVTKSQLKESELNGRTPPFVGMSLKPAIAKEWFDKYYRDAYSKNSLNVDGRMVAIPRYFDKLFAKKHPEVMEQLKLFRSEAAQNAPLEDISFPRNEVHNYYDKLKMKGRNL